MTQNFQHKDLAAGRWFTLTLAEQMGNVGSEVSRMLKWRDRDPKLFQGAFERALDLLDLTMRDRRWRKRLKEIARSREFLVDGYFGGSEYNSKLEDLDRYFLQFAVAARAAL